MSFVLTIAQRKGGAGKTTLACHLIAELLSRDSLRITTIDVDPQKSLSYWVDLRHERAGEDPHHDHITAEGFRAISEARAAKRKSDLVLIDTPPHNDTAARQSMRLADLVLIPMQLTPFDLAATSETARLVADSGADPFIVYNRTPARSRVADRIRGLMTEFDLPVAPVELGHRTAYAETLLHGRGVTEAVGASQAADEVRRLADFVMAQTGEAVRAA